MSSQGSNRGGGGMRLGMGGGMRLTGESARQTRSTLYRLFAYLRPYRLRVGLVAVLVIMTTLLSLLGPVLLGRAIDNYIVPRDFPGLVNLALIMVGVYVLMGAGQMVQGILMVGVGQRLVADVRAELFGHLQRLSMAYHDRHKTGDLMSRNSNDTEAINSVLSNGLIDFVGNVLGLGGIMIAMFLLNWQLALGTVLILPIMLYITGEVTRRSRMAFRTVQRNLGALNVVMEENIAGVRVVQAFAREADTVADFVAVNTESRRAGIRADIITAALGPMFTTMSTITIAATAFLGGWLALRGIVQVGVLATFVVYIMNFFRPMRGIAMLYNQLQSALAGAERIFEVLDAAPAVQDAPDAKPLTAVRGHVVFDDVSFAYDADKPV
ncbi:MAG: ABC transporter ATP-binding protein, partial [Litorilinea sp.]